MFRNAIEDLGDQGGLLHWGADLAFIAARCKGRQVYLATPITKVILAHRDDPARAARLVGHYAAIWVGLLAQAGVSAVSPSVLSVHALLASGKADELRPGGLTDAVFWVRWCGPLLQASAAVVVPDLPGWDASEGVFGEVRFALSQNRPVFLMAERDAR